MRVLHGLVLALAAAALLARIVLEEPASLSIAGLAALAAFILSGGALALDVLDRRWRWAAAVVAATAVALSTVFIT